MQKIITISVFTATRADYGILSNIIKLISKDDFIKLQLIVSGTHLSNTFGNTVNEIEQDGLNIDHRIPLEYSTDTSSSVLKNMATVLTKLGQFYSSRKPDIVVILGDRYEALAAAQVASISNIPIAHLHGGEETLGANDNQFRHAITKLSHLHFTATEKYRERVIKMGENPENTYNTGAPGLENIHSLSLMNKQELSEKLDIKWSKYNILMTFHPETINPSKSLPIFKSILTSLSSIKDVSIIITYPNSDLGSKELIDELISFQSETDSLIYVFTNLGMHKYLSSLKEVDLVIGNSSSGIIEAPSLRTPTLDIGTRQTGREHAESIIHITGEEDNLTDIIATMLTKKYEENDFINPYDTKNTSSLIVDIIKDSNLITILNKSFFN